MYMAMFVLDNPDFLDEILNSWSDSGISGATITESTGFHRQLTQHIPMRYIYGGDQEDQLGNITIFILLKTKKQIKTCLECVEKIVGSLDDPNTGVFAAWPVEVVKGVPSV